MSIELQRVRDQHGRGITGVGRDTVTVDLRVTESKVTMPSSSSSALASILPSRETGIHLFAGGVAGTTGAVITCPLEVVKTRLQSSNSGFGNVSSASSSSPSSSGKAQQPPSSLKPPPRSAATAPAPNVLFDRNQQTLRLAMRCSSTSSAATATTSPGVLEWWDCIKYIKRTEGMRGLYKGLGPNIVGVAPSRAIYFWAYSTAKKYVNSSLPKRNRDTPLVHVLAAGMAGFTASSLTNPIWLVKTRLQLDKASGENTLSVRKCIRNIVREYGIRGLWKGVTASYWGICETMMHWMVYEYLKKQLAEYKARNSNGGGGGGLTGVDMFGLMGCGACSRLCATAIAYPHEVARTRLREGNPRYSKFWQTIFLVYREEGRRGLYRGMVTQLCRQIPNTAIMMVTYEFVVYGLSRWWRDEPADQKKPALVEAAPAAKRLSGWDAGAKKDANGSEGGSCNVRSELK